MCVVGAWAESSQSNRSFFFDPSSVVWYPFKSRLYPFKSCILSYLYRRPQGIEKPMKKAGSRKVYTIFRETDRGTQSQAKVPQTSKEKEKRERRERGDRLQIAINNP